MKMFFPVKCSSCGSTAEMRLLFNMHKTIEKVLNELEKLGMMELVWEPNASLLHEVPALLGTDSV